MPSRSITVRRTDSGRGYVVRFSAGPLRIRDRHWVGAVSEGPSGLSRRPRVGSVGLAGRNGTPERMKHRVDELCPKSNC